MTAIEKGAFEADARAGGACMMESLKRRLDRLLEWVPVERPVVYLDYPVHLNFGDILIMRGTERFFAQHGHRVIARHGYMNFTARAREQVPRDAVVVLHGGGNFGDLYPVHQRFREEIVQSFPHNRIVVLAQSVHFSSPEELDRSAVIFERHRDLVLCVRDPRSMGLVKGRFAENVCLVPDMAHQLWTPVAAADDDRPTLVCLRTDKEALAPQHLQAVGSATTFDWLDFIPRWSCRVFGRILWLHRMEGNSGNNLGAQRAWYRYCALLHAHMESVFGNFGDVVTSRLHGMIFAALLGKRVRYIDNTYGKLGVYAETWLRSSRRIARY